uniref:Uncharacterized protein n=1 Tax=Octopus bimaculoides TaxID=37653 RepID=A0A0L8IAB9_OCTBM
MEKVQQQLQEDHQQFKEELCEVSGDVIWCKQQIDEFGKRMESVEKLCATESKVAERGVVVDTDPHHDVLVFKPRSREVQGDIGIPIRKKPQEFNGKVSWENEWDERQRAVQLATSLKGPALEVLSQLSVKDRSCYSTLVEVLQRKYGNMYQHEMHRACFHTHVRARGEPLQQLAQYLESTVHKAYPTPTLDLLVLLLKEQFINTLDSVNFKVQVKQSQPTTMQEALARALEFELHCTELRGLVNILTEVAGQEYVLLIYVVEMEDQCILGLDYLASMECQLNLCQGGKVDHCWLWTTVIPPTTAPVQFYI